MHASLKEVLKFIGRSAKRVAVTVIGFALVALGIVMFVLPGPGFLVVIAGLVVLATEYVWAQVMLDKARERAKQAGNVAKQGLSRVRRRKRVDLDVDALEALDSLEG